MAFKTGKPESLKDKLSGYEKLTKDQVCEKPLLMQEVIKGRSAEYGEYVIVLGRWKERAAYVSVPQASEDIFADWNVSDNDIIANGIFYLVMEKSVSKNNREYYTCYIKEDTENPFK